MTTLGGLRSALSPSRLLKWFAGQGTTTQGTTTTEGAPQETIARDAVALRDNGGLGVDAPAIARKRRRRPPRHRGERREGQAPALNGARPASDEALGQDNQGPFLFGQLQLSAAVGRAIHDMGYLDPTPIQSGVITRMMGGKDVVGQAQTGTGKTSAFGIPLVEMVDPSLDAVQAIVLVPTRELAQQVTKEIERLAKYRRPRVVALYGGQPIVKQFVRLDPPPQIIVGTPGRVLDHISRSTLHLDRVKIAVLDEADEMLDIGFAPDMERILRLTPKTRQTALFSATIPPFIMRLIHRYLRNPEWISIQPEEAKVPEEIDQVYLEVAERDKLPALTAMLSQWGELPRTLVFCRMQIGVDRLTANLQRRGYKVEGIHGGMTQSERNRVMTGFRDGSIQALIATNVAARGLDIPDITHVVSYDAPQNVEEYIHRTGRTGRMGRKGLAITLFAEWDMSVLDQVKKAMGSALREEKSTIYSTADTAV